jgi:hypothetical protein
MPNVNAKVAAPKVVASHSAGFDAALDKALLAASKLGRKGVFNVNVEFWRRSRSRTRGRSSSTG